MTDATHNPTPATQRKPPRAVERRRLAGTGSLDFRLFMKAAPSRALAAAFAGLAGLLGLGVSLHAAGLQPRLSGDTRIHDPSRHRGRRPIRRLRHRRAGADARRDPGQDLARRGRTGRTPAPSARAPPKWAAEALGYQPTNVWAPSVSRRGQTFNLYYALSSFGSNASAIGLMTNTSFDVAKPGEGWKDEGLVLQSKARRRLQRHRPVSRRSLRRPRVSRLRLLLVRDQAAASSTRKPASSSRTRR